MNRRKFLQSSVLASTAMFLPRFLKGQTLLSANKPLVVIQLTGGNDALNMLVPFRDDNYYRLRPTIGINKSDLLLAGDTGFHPSLSGVYSLFDEGSLTIINNTGYPEPDRSHFRAMDIWQSASGSGSFINTGWIGRYLDHIENPKSHFAIEADDTLSLALKGEVRNGLAVKNPERLFRNLSEGYFSDIAKSDGHHTHHQASYLYKTLSETVESADYIYKKSHIYKSKEKYPDSEFSRNLKTISELIISGSETKIYYASLSGFDTHIQQKPRQDQVLKTLDEGLSAFTSDLKSNKKFEDVLILIFSEFGRRVEQNASNGTDHGKAGVVMLASGSLKKKGMINSLPDLSKLDDGDLKHQTDFRNIYATILKKWFGANPDLIIPGFNFELMNFI